VAVAVVVGIALLGGFGGASRAAQTFTVNVDGHNPKANEAFIAYYPSTVRVHPGDTVVFHEVGNDEPHTVTLGTITDKIVAAFDKLTPKQQQQGTPPRSFIRLDATAPQLLPQGPGDAIQSASNPCYLSSGAPPKKGACAKAAEPDFTGKESFYNSGWLNSKAKFTIHLSSSIAPGTYRFMCLLHREGMTGKVVVVPSSTSVPSPSAQYATGQKTLEATEAKLQAAATALRSGNAPGVTVPAADHVLGGSGSPSVQGALITEFGPAKLKIPVGGSVTWWLIGPHTITFDANKSDDDIRSVAPDGSVHLNAKALAPAKGPGEPHSAGSSGNSNGPPKFKLVASTKWHGGGFLNSGIFVNSGPPLIEGYKITFTKAGNYKYICTVHDDMKGEVDVG
jgi:plastocyanin